MAIRGIPAHNKGILVSSTDVMWKGCVLSDNVSYLYGLKRANGEPKDGGTTKNTC